LICEAEVITDKGSFQKIKYTIDDLRNGELFLNYEVIDPPMPSLIATSTPEPTPITINLSINAGPIEIRDLVLDKDFGAITKGIVKNKSSALLNEIYIYFRGYDKEKIRIAEGIALIENLAPNEAALFEGGFLSTESNRVTDFKIYKIEIDGNIFITEDLENTDQLPSPTATALT
jgi:hypothetical protein